MAQYDRVDEAVIHAAPEGVWSALEGEFTGEMQAGFARLDRRLAAAGADPRRTELSSAGAGGRGSRGTR